MESLSGIQALSIVGGVLLLFVIAIAISTKRTNAKIDGVNGGGQKVKAAGNTGRGESRGFRSSTAQRSNSRSGRRDVDLDDEDDGFVESAVISGVTGDPVLGAVVGGSVAGAIVGTVIGGSDDDEDDRRTYVADTPSYSSDDNSSSSSSDSSSSYDSGGDD